MGNSLVQKHTFPSSQMEGPMLLVTPSEVKRGRGQHGLIKKKASSGLAQRRNALRRCPAPNCSRKLYAFQGRFDTDSSTGEVVPVTAARPTGTSQKQHDFSNCHCEQHQLFFHRPAGQPLGSERDHVCCYGCGNTWEFVNEGDRPRKDNKSHCTCAHEEAPKQQTKEDYNPWSAYPQAPAATAAVATSPTESSPAVKLHQALLAGNLSVLAFASAATFASVLTAQGGATSQLPVPPQTQLPHPPLQCDSALTDTSRASSTASSAMGSCSEAGTQASTSVLPDTPTILPMLDDEVMLLPLDGSPMDSSMMM